MRKTWGPLGGRIAMQILHGYTLPDQPDMNPICRHVWVVKRLSGLGQFFGGIFFLELFVNNKLLPVLCSLFEKMQPAEEMVDGGNDLSKVRGSNPIFCQIQNFWQEYWPWHAKKVYQTQTKHRPKTEITKRRNAHFTHFNQNFQCSPPCQILRTNHPMVETPPPLTGYQQRNARMSALLIPLIVRWREWFLIGVVLLLLLLPQAKKSAKKAWRRWWSTNIFQSKRVLDRDPDLPLRIEDTYCPPNTRCDGGGGGGEEQQQPCCVQRQQQHWQRRGCRGGDQHEGDIPPALNARGGWWCWKTSIGACPRLANLSLVKC